MELYYIPYEENADINYIYLFTLYNMAEFNKDDKLFNLINYHSISKLTDRINEKLNIYNIGDISNSTTNRILNDTRYFKYIDVDKVNKIIKIKNNIKTSKKFIILNKREVNILLNYKDNLMIKYYLYVKYYCNYSKSKEQDFTIKQFLAAAGYSINSNNYINNICSYNNILQECGLITIKKYRDDNGYVRNIYQLR